MNTSNNSSGELQNQPSISSTNNQLVPLRQSKLFHVLDDNSLTFEDIEDIFFLAWHNKLEDCTQKIDGSFLWFTYKSSTQEIRVARSNKEVLLGGLTRSELFRKYSSEFCVESGIQQIFDNVVCVLHDLVYLYHNKDIFDDGNIFFPIEIVYPNKDHTILIDSLNIVLHQYPVINSDLQESKINEQHEIFQINCNKNIVWVSNIFVYNPIKALVSSKTKFKKYEILNKFSNDLLSLLRKLNLKKSNTIKDYLRKRMEQYFSSHNRFISSRSDDTIQAIINRILHVKGCRNITYLKQIVKNGPQFDLSKYIDNKLFMHKMLQPLEDVFNNYTHQLLQHIEPVIKGSVTMTQINVSNIINDDRWKTLDLIPDELQIYTEKLKSVDNIIPLEGIVFFYKGKYYKMTGYFAAANQLLNLQRKYFKNN